MAGKNQILNRLTKTPFPENIRPMLATLYDKPFNSKEWIFEIKWDGYRVISKKRKNTTSLNSRNLNSFDNLFPGITRSLKKIKGDFVIDGEAVAIDESNRPSFQQIQNHHKTGQGNIVYYVFDLLWLNGYSTELLPVTQRKELLKELIPGLDNILYCEHIAESGVELFKEVTKLNIEGIIAKKADSRYYENTRSQSWLKIKTEHTIDAVICGYTEPRGSRKYFGALILGVFNAGKLTYIGHTGTGFNFSIQQKIFSILKKHSAAKSPFTNPLKPNAPVTWLKPRLVCEVKFSQLTKDGILRHPVFLRMRDDKEAEEVTFVSQFPGITNKIKHG